MIEECVPMQSHAKIFLRKSFENLESFINLAKSEFLLRLLNRGYGKFRFKEVSRCQTILFIGAIS